MKMNIEIISLIAEKKDILEILPCNMETLNSYISTKIYNLIYEGTKTEIVKIFKKIFLNDIIETIQINKNYYYKKSALIIDVHLRKGARSLEKEYTKKYINYFSNSKNKISDITIGKRYYLFGNTNNTNYKTDKKKFLKFGPENPTIMIYKSVKKSY